MKIKDLFKELLAICVLVPLLHNFCNAETFTFNGYVSGDSVSNGVVLFSYSMPKQYNKGDQIGSSRIKCQFTGTANGRLYVYKDDSTTSSNYTVSNPTSTLERNVNFNIMSMYYMTTSSLTNYSLEYNCDVETTGHFQGGSCDYSEFENTINTLSGNLATCNSNFNSCKSNLSTATGNLATCQFNLSFCQSDLATATGNLATCQSNISGYQNSLNNCSNNLNQCSTSLSSCLSANCPNNTGNVSWSALFINNIQHIGSPIIRMTIPEELSWDYAYTDSGNNMEIDIEGYNVDYDYINGVVNVQKYKPTTEDFTNIVSNLGSYFKILVFLLFAFIVISWITKSFKSKLK